MARKRPARPRIPRISKARSAAVMRAEFNRAVEILNRRTTIIEEHAVMLSTISRDQDIQFRRIAEIQAEIDAVRRLLAKLVTTA